MAGQPSITYWNRLEPSPLGNGLRRGLEAAVRDPLWFLTRQWQLGEFHGEDAATPAFVTVSARSIRPDAWGPGEQPAEPYDGHAPLEVLSQDEDTTPDLRTAVELGQALEERLRAENVGDEVVLAFRRTFPVPRVEDLSEDQARDRALVRLARVCGGRTTHGINALRAHAVSTPALPAGLGLPENAHPSAGAALSWLADWAETVFGRIGLDDADGWRPDRLEYELSVGASTPTGNRLTLRGHPGRHGDLDWYAFDEVARTAAGDVEVASSPVHRTVLPAPVDFAGMPDRRWWTFEDARFDWAGLDADRRELGKVVVLDFMLIQGNDWFTVPIGQEVGTLATIDQFLVSDVFGEWTLVERAGAGTVDQPRWTLFSTTADGTPSGLTDYLFLPPGALRSTLDGPDLEEVRFVRDEQANMVWAIEAITEDAAGRAWSGRERAIDEPDPAPPAPNGVAPLHYRLQSSVPVNWIPFAPVRTDGSSRTVALRRAAIRRVTESGPAPVQPVGRVLRPSALTVPGTYELAEEEVPRSGIRVLRAARRARWVDGSAHLWTSRRRRIGEGGGVSGLRHDIAEPTDHPGPRGDDDT